MLTKSSRSLFLRAGAASCVFIALSNLGMGAILYWDTDGTTDGLQGGNGTWSTAVSNWNTNVTGTGTWSAWTNFDSANFESTGTATITTSGTPSVGGINFGASNVTIEGGDLSLWSTASGISTSLSATINAKLLNGGIFKEGSGILTLSGNNSYAGKTDINAGTVVINGDQSAAKGDLLVGGTTRLAGTGIIGADLTQVVGVHGPGLLGGIGEQTFESDGGTVADLIYTSVSIFEWQLDRTQSQTRGVGYDAVKLEGAISRLGATDAAFRIVIGDSDFSNPFWNTSKVWEDIFVNTSNAAISDWTNVFSTGSVANFQFYNTSGGTISPAGQGSFSMTGNTLSWTAVPEPTSAVVGLLVLGGVLRRRRS